MAPSAVNDSARAMAARLREWADDISSKTATGGTSTAYTVATNQVFDTLAHLNGELIAFVPHATCGATVTLNVDGLGAKPLRTSPGVEVPAGMLIQGTPYVAAYSNVDSAFYLRGFYQIPYTVPIGGLMPYLGSTAPNSNFVLPFGQAISRITYSSLFSLVGTTFGTGDGSTTFNIPDLRGRAIFGLDNMGGGAASRITVAGGNFDGTVRGGTGGAENHILTTAEMPVHSHSINDPGHSHATAIFKDQLTNGAGSNAYGATGGGVPTTTNTTGIAINNAGSGGAHTILSPAMTLPYILRVV
jgi:microcystin-dependent protein